VRLLILTVAAVFVLSGCHKTDPPGAAPTGVTATPGDGLVVISWETLPELTYWIFFQPGSAVSVATPDSIAIRRAISPRPVTGLTNGIQYAFAMNATHDDSSAGPNSLSVVATPRLAGADWGSGTQLGSPPQNLKSIALNGTRFVAVGDAAAIFAGDLDYTSVDPPGIFAWMPPVSLPIAFSSDLACVISNGTFTALGTDGSTMTSGDGLNWTSGGRVPAIGMSGLAFGFVTGVTPTFFAVGAGGNIFASTDNLVSWNPVSSGTSSDLTGIFLLNSAFFVTGAGGTLLTSPSGAGGTWAPLVTNTANTLRSVAFNPRSLGNPYVAVGDAATILTSPDGVSWTPVAPSAITPPLTQDLRSVTVGGATASRFLAVGQTGAVAYSDDGLNWSSASSGLSNNLAGVLYAAGLYLAVGDAGANAVAR
jgi:hypothetical protein